MLKFTSVSGSVRAITDITLTVIIIRTDIIDLITVRIGMAGIATIVTIIVIPIITGTNLAGIATPGWLEPNSSQPNFFSWNSLKRSGGTRQSGLFF
jgi:hypothetical protein